jgi:hypothetical protein
VCFCDNFSWLIPFVPVLFHDDGSTGRRGALAMDKEKHTTVEALLLPEALVSLSGVLHGCIRLSQRKSNKNSILT